MKKAQKTNTNEFATKAEMNKGFEDLAGIVGRGFESVENKISGIDSKVDSFAKNLNDFRVEVKNEFRQVTGILVKNHEERITALEKRARITS